MTIIREEKFSGLPASFSSIRKDIVSSNGNDMISQLRDEAKKSAISRSRDYEEFRGLVDTCHLKPLSRSDFSSKPTANYYLSRHETAKSLEAPGNAVVVSRVSSEGEFFTKFQKLHFGDRLRFLEINSDALVLYCSGKVEESFFFDLLDVILSADSDESLVDAKKILIRIRDLPWFKVRLIFLSLKEKEALARLEDFKLDKIV
jgi:hypothetical protein